MKKLLIFSLLALSFGITKSQELFFRLQINYSQIQGTNTMVFQDMQKTVYEFLNNTKWTDHVFSENERIECNILIKLSEQIGTERFVGTITVQASRPVFNSTYSSPLLNYPEAENSFKFEYIEGQPLDFNINTYSSLTSTLAFYSYLILGLDYDTYGRKGGDAFFNKAWQIVTNAQNSADPGWKSFEGTNNRYWLIENLTNAAYSSLHDFLYEYHRTGLDLMSEKPDEGRANIATSLENLRKVHQRKPNIPFMTLLLTAKREEIINIFSKSFPREQTDVLNVMKVIDPLKSDEYQKIMSK